jgi:hypothetical protein
MIRVVLDIPKAAPDVEFQKLRTEPLHVYARATTQYVNLRDSADYVNLKNTVTFVNAYALSSYVQLAAANVFADPTPPDRWVNDTIQVPADQAFLIFDKNLVDAVNALDASTLDFGLGLGDLFGVYDFSRFDAGKHISDQTDGFSELLAFDTSKGFSDLYSAIDAVSKGFEKSLETSNGTTDSARISSGKSLSDEFPQIDEIILDFGLSLSDLQSVEEAHSLETSKGASENVVFGDGISSVFSTHRADETSAIDNFSYLAFFGRTEDDVEYAIDDSLLEFGKNPSESLAASDSGYARMTDYADITYFAEDYVGSSFYF